jgi:GR25 family glycosyltransferase involved in LPS biosynthesis
MKAFVIYLADREHSVISSQKTLESLRDCEVDAELFAGVNGEQAMAKAKKAKKVPYPFGIKNRELGNNELLAMLRPEIADTFATNYFGKIYKRQSLDDCGAKQLSPGVMGCFYSHYSLWERCLELDEPIMIFEDDVKVYRGFKPVIWDEVLVLALGKTTYLNEPYKDYLENPTGIPQALRWRNYSMPGCVGYALKPYAAKKLVRFWGPYWTPADNAINSSICEIQIANYQMGRTTLAEEGNISSVRTKEPCHVDLGH